MIKISSPDIRKEEMELVMQVLKSGQLAQGPRVKELEEDFSKLCGAKSAIATK